MNQLKVGDFVYYPQVGWPRPNRVRIARCPVRRVCASDAPGVIQELEITVPEGAENVLVRAVLGRHCFRTPKPALRALQKYVRASLASVQKQMAQMHGWQVSAYTTPVDKLVFTRRGWRGE